MNTLEIDVGDLPPSWVVWSTRESINNDVPSVTAIIETVLAVIVYWWVAIRFESYLPLLISAAVAPLVLLRSDESVALGVKWFLTWSKRSEETWRGNTEEIRRDSLRNKRHITWAIGLFTAAGLGVCFLVYQLPLATRGWSALWSGFAVAWVWLFFVGAGAAALLGGAGSRSLFAFYAFVTGGSVGMIGALAWSSVGALAGVTAGIGVVALAGITRPFFPPLALPVFIGIPTGVLIVGLSVRIIATLKHIVPGFRSLARNFRRLVVCTSPL